MEQVLEGIEMGAAMLFFLAALFLCRHLTRECDRMYQCMEQIEHDNAVWKEEGTILNEWLEDE